MKMKMKCLLFSLVFMLGFAGGCQPEVRLERPVPVQYIRVPKV